MKILEWKEEYLLGIPAVDLQHRRIYDCFIAIAEEGLSGHEAWHEDASFARLVDLLRQHFALEESMMRSLGYPELERHIEEHRRFDIELHHLARKSRELKGCVSREILEAFHKWPQEHILTSDRHYLNYFAGPQREGAGRKRQES